MYMAWGAGNQLRHKISVAPVAPYLGAHPPPYQPELAVPNPHKVK